MPMSTSRAVVGVGTDLVHVPTFAAQLALPGSRFERVFTAGERRDAQDRVDDPAVHLAARWAAKEAVVKAWSASIFGHPPVLTDDIWPMIEVVCDAWNRPAITLHGSVAAALPGHIALISLSHDADYAMAHATLLAPTPQITE